MAESIPPTPVPPNAVPASPPSALSLPGLLPSPCDPPPKRADLISLKQRLAQLLSPHPELGELYWNGLTEFILGKVTRIEFGQVMDKCLGKSSPSERIQAINLHNALLLSILYNTTRPTLPSSSIRHTGFNPRGTKKRNLLSIITPGGGYEGGDEETQVSEHRRNKVKEAVLRVGKRERAEIKARANQIGVVASASMATLVSAKEEEGESVGEALRSSRGGQGQVGEGGVPKGYKDQLDHKGISVPNNFTQEYNRLIQAPLCCESRSLPDADILRDRTTLIAYEEGLTDGVEGQGIPNLLSNAIDSYLKQILSSAVSLVRGPTQPSEPRLSSQSALKPPSTSFAPAGGLSPLPDVASPGTPPSSNEPPTRKKRRTLAISDFHALFAIQPALLGPNGSTHTSAVERMYALPPQSDSEDDSMGEQEEEPQARGRDVTVKDSTGDTSMSLDDPPPNASSAASAPAPISGKMPRLSTASRNRGLSFYGAARPIAPPLVPPTTTTSSSSASASSTSKVPTPARTKFLLDPTSLHGVPEGHPDVPHVSSSSSILPPLVPLAPTTPASNVNDSLLPVNTPGGGGATNNSNSNNNSSQTLSPKSLSLRNSLFPELATSSTTPNASTSGGGGGGGGGTNGGSSSGIKNSDRGRVQGGGSNRGEGEGKNGNGTTTDEADSELDDLTDKIAGELSRTGGVGKNGGGSGGLKNSTTNGGGGGGGGGLKIKLGGTTTGTVTPTPVSTPGAGGGGGPKSAGDKDKDKEMGRKLWEVVDSVRLLDGVLDP